MNDIFPLGTRFYAWNTLPLASIPTPKGRIFLNYAAEPPSGMFSLAELHSAREVAREVFEALRSAQRALLRAA